MNSAAREPLVLGRYRIVRRVAKGGMGVVYLGRLEGAAGFAKPVIIKRVLPDAENLEECTARFIREAQILSHLQHPCIVGVLDFGSERDGYAMVLEYMHGYDLGRWLRYLQLTATQLPWEEAVFVMLRALQALEYAHALRLPDGTPTPVLHRDISPGNILIDTDGQVRVLDFDIARMDEEDSSYCKTQEGVLHGKVGFLAPELFAAAPPSPSSDVYACAVVLYQMLTGVHPFTAENDSRTMWRIVQEQPKPLDSFRDDLPAELEGVLFRCLAKDPEERFASAEQCAWALRRLLQRDEAELQLALRERVRRDFCGDMPERLRIEPLQERDRAWRMAQGERERESLAPLRSSRAPAPPSMPATLELRVPPSPAGRPVAAPRVASSAPTALAKPDAALIAAAKRAAEPGAWQVQPERSETGTSSWERAGTNRPGRRLSTRAVLLVGVALMGLGLLGVVLFRPRAPASAQFIVVEGSRAGAAAAEVAVAPAIRASASAEASVAPGPDASGAENPQQEQSTVARQLARRQSALLACAQKFPEDLSGPITLSVDIAASGQVSAADLAPESLVATDGGRCLLGIARETRFAPLSKPLHLSVPLQARARSR